MGVEITKGGLAFTSDLDTTGFAKGANKIKKLENDIRQGIEEGTKAQKAFSDEMLRNAQLAQYRTKVRVLGTKEEITSLETLIKQQRELQVLQATTTDPNKLKRYNRSLEETTAEIVRMRNAGKVGFDDMGNKVETITKKANGFSRGINAVWGGLKTIANILPGLGIAGLLAFAIDPIMDYIKSLDFFKKKLKDTVTENGIDTNEYKKAVSDISALGVALEEMKSGTISRTEVVARYNETIGKTVGQLKNVEQVEAFYNSKADAYIEATLLRAKAQSALQLAVEETNKATKRAATDYTLGDKAKGAFAVFSAFMFGKKGKLTYGDYYDNQLKRSKEADIKEAEEESKKYTELFKELQKQSDEFNKKNKFDFRIASKGNERKKAINEQIRIQQQIDSLEAEYSRKSLSRDEAEVQSVRDKFKKMADAARRFNENPRNKRLGIAVDTSNLNKVRDTAIADLEYKQETAKQAIAFEKMKQLYADYEQYKTNFGEQAAKQRYGNEVRTNAELLEGLQKQYDELSSKTTLTGNEKSRKEQLKKQIDDLTKIERDRYDNMLKETLSYEQKRAILIEAYNAKRAELEKNGDYNAVTVLDTIHKEALGKLDDDNNQKLAAFKALFNGIENLSDKAAKKVIEDGKLMLAGLSANGKISAEQTKQMAEKLKDSTKALEDRLPTKLKNLGNELRSIAGLIGDVDFGKWLGGIGDVVSGLGKMKEQINTINTDWYKMDNIEKFSSGLGLFGTGVNIVTSIGRVLDSVFSRGAKARDEQALYASNLQLKQTEALNRALDRQLEIISKIYGTEKLTEYSKAIAEINKQTEETSTKLSNLYRLTGDVNIDKLITKVNQGQSIGPVERDYLNKLLKNGTIIKIDANDLKELQRLLDNNLLDEKSASFAKTILDNYKKLGEVAVATKEELTGSTFTGLADGIIDAITNGAENGAKNFEDIMRKAMVNSLKSKYITAQLEKFYEDFAKASASGLDDEKIKILQAQYNKIIEDGKKAASDIEKATGISFSDNSSKKQGELSKGFQGITESTANRLEAEFGGMRLGQLEGNSIIRSGFENIAKINQQMLNASLRNAEMAIKIERNTGRTAENTEPLRDIKKSLESIDKKIGGSDALKRGSGI